MKRNFKVGEKVRLYRANEYSLFDKGCICEIKSFFDDKYVIVCAVPKDRMGLRWDCVKITWLAHVKE